MPRDTPAGTRDVATASPDTGDAARVTVAFDVRYRGQAHELTLRDVARDAGVAALRVAFEELHEERYGYRDEDAPIEVVTIRATASVAGPRLDLAAGTSREPPAEGGWAGRDGPSDALGPTPSRARREVVFDGERLDAEILRGEPAPGDGVTGPAICELPEATLTVAPGWRGRVDGAGTIVLRRHHE